jgi:hypothetical protein
MEDLSANHDNQESRNLSDMLDRVQAHVDKGELDAARELVGAAEKMAADSGIKSDRAATAAESARIFLLSGDVEGARRLCKEADALAETAESRLRLLCAEAGLELNSARYARLFDIIKVARDRVAYAADAVPVLRILGAEMSALRELGRFPEARSVLRRYEDLCKGLPQVWRARGKLLGARLETAAAANADVAVTLHEAVDVFRAGQYRLDLSEAIGALALAVCAKGETDVAVNWAIESSELAARSGVVPARARALLVLGETQIRRGFPDSVDAGKASLAEAVPLARQCDMPEVLWRIHHCAGLGYVRSANPIVARVEFKSAMAIVKATWSGLPDDMRNSYISLPQRQALRDDMHRLV